MLFNLKWVYQQIMPNVQDVGNQGGDTRTVGQRACMVVVQGKEAYIERKIGGDKEAPNIST